MGNYLGCTVLGLYNIKIVVNEPEEGELPGVHCFRSVLMLIECLNHVDDFQTSQFSVAGDGEGCGEDDGRRLFELHLRGSQPTSDF